MPYYCFSELALYALDVYYNQTYGTSTQFFSKIDDDYAYGYANQNGNSNSYYGEFPPYYDPFTGTYRSFDPKWKNLDKVIEWLDTAYSS